jgi:hypothetical protein
VKRLEKRLLIFERESGRLRSDKDKDESKDPREAIAELLGMINIDTFLRTVKQAMGDDEDTYWSTLEQIVSDKRGFDVAEVSTLLEQEKSKRQQVELQLTKASDKRELTLARRDLDQEKQKAEKLTAERNGLNTQLENLQRMWAALEKEHSSLKAEHKTSSSALDAAQSKLTLVENEKSQMQKRLDKLAASASMQATQQAKSDTSDNSLVLPAQTFLTEVAAKYTPDDLCVAAAGLVKEMREEVQVTFSKQILPVLHSKACSAIAGAVSNLDASQLPSPARVTMVSAAMKSIGQDDMTQLLGELPVNAKKSIAMEAANLLANAEDVAEEEKRQKEQGGQKKSRRRR